MTRPVSVLVPYRGDQGGPRDRAWEFVRAWWAREHPTFTVIVGEDPDPAGLWCKATAVAAALALAGPADLLVIADADLICYGIGLAVEVVQSQGAPWAMPHHRVNRLTEAATRAVLAGGPLPGTPPYRRHNPADPPTGRSADVAESYKGALAGGLVVLPRALYERVPLDPRFAGWGQEDVSWGRALTLIGGQPWRGPDPLWHLWHPAPARLNRKIGNVAGHELHLRYLNVHTGPDMEALLAETSSPVG